MSRNKCDCPCHQGAGVLHYKNEPVENSHHYDIETNTFTSYSTSTRMVMTPRPCDLNNKIAEVTKEYYASK